MQPPPAASYSRGMSVSQNPYPFSADQAMLVPQQLPDPQGHYNSHQGEFPPQINFNHPVTDIPDGGRPFNRPFRR